MKLMKVWFPRIFLMMKFLLNNLILNVFCFNITAVLNIHKIHFMGVPICISLYIDSSFALKQFLPSPGVAL